MSLRDYDDQTVFHNGADPLRRFRLSAEGAPRNVLRTIDMSMPSLFEGWIVAWTDFTSAMPGVGPANNGGFTDQMIAAGTRATVVSTASAHPGRMNVTSAAAANSGVSVRVDGLPILGGECVACCFWTPASLTNITNTYGMFEDGTSIPEPGSGCYWWLAGGNITPKNAIGGVRTAGTPVALAVETWYTVIIRPLPDRSGCLFRLYNADTGALLSEQTITANMPAVGPLSFGAKHGTSAGAAISCGDFDFLFARYGSPALPFARFIGRPDELFG